MSPTTSHQISWWQLWYKSQEYLSLSVIAITRFREKENIVYKQVKSRAFIPWGFWPNSLIAMAILHDTITCSEMKKNTRVLILKKFLNVHISLCLIEADSMLEIFNCDDSSPSPLLASDYIQEGDASKAWDFQVIWVFRQPYSFRYFWCYIRMGFLSGGRCCWS